MRFCDKLKRWNTELTQAGFSVYSRIDHLYVEFHLLEDGIVTWESTYVFNGRQVRDLMNNFHGVKSVITGEYTFRAK